MFYRYDVTVLVTGGKDFNVRVEVPYTEEEIQPNGIYNTLFLEEVYKELDGFLTFDSVSDSIEDYAYTCEGRVS